jgi:lipopolysaccharide transport system permease protein
LYSGVSRSTDTNLPGRHFVRNLFERRTLIAQLVRRDFEQRYIGSAAGWLWGIIHPMVLLVSYTFVFQFCMRVPLPATAVTQNYPLFLFCGFLPWMLFQETVQRSSTSLLEQANLLTKTVFPAEVIPVSVFLSSLVSHLLALVLGVFIILFWAGHYSPLVLLLPVYTVLTGFLAIGIGWIVSSLQVYLRDTAQVLTVVLTFWFWVTPIFIDELMFPARVRFLVRLNPMAYVVRAYRERLLSSNPPSVQEFAILAACAAGIFLAGGLFFRHLKRGFADVL